MISASVLSQRSDTNFDDRFGHLAATPRLRKVPKRGPGRPAIIVSNHQGFVDIFTQIISPLSPGFCPMIEVASMPFIGILAKGLQSLFLNRGGSVEERDMAI